MSRFRWLLPAALFLAAAGARADAECRNVLDFADDGAIAQWEVCSGGRPAQTFAAPAEPRLALRISVERELVDARWVSPDGNASQGVTTSHGEGASQDGIVSQSGNASPDGNASQSVSTSQSEGALQADIPRAEWRFRGVDSVHLLEVTRTYRSVEPGVLEHSISVTNGSGRPVRDVRLALDPGGALPRDHADTGALADFFYSFHRPMIVDDEGDWAGAELDRAVRAFAHVVRHKTLIIDSAEPMTLVDPTYLDSTLADSTPADSMLADPTPADPTLIDSTVVDATEDPAADAPRAAAGPLQLVLAVPEIAAGETVILRQRIAALPTETPALAAAGYEGLTYAHLATPIAWLSATAERALVGLSALAGPGLAVILLAVAVRVVTLPASLWSARRQSEFAAVVERMKPEIAHARASYSGAEQSERILAIYKENGVSPFSGLKGSFGLFLQIPFLLAVFNVTTLSSGLYGAPFLWIEDLSLADAAAPLPASIMLFGSHLNALPLALGAVFLISPAAGATGAAGLRTGPVIATVLTVALVYTFAAALLLYWLTTNIFQAGERYALRGRPAGGLS